MKHSGIRSEKAFSPPLGASLSVFTSAVPYICAQRGRWRESDPPSFTLSESLTVVATTATSAAASNHGHNGPAFTPSVCCILVAVWVIRHWSIAGVFFTPEHDTTNAAKGSFFCNGWKESGFCGSSDPSCGTILAIWLQGQYSDTLINNCAK